jgi:mannose-1-phosphate guanylyltransferase/mannose-6-phosphate isomerase
MAVVPVILCGGGGVRLWPTSSQDRPKQFAPLLGPLSSFQMTVRRVAPLAGASPLLVVTGAPHVPQVRAQLAVLGVAARLIIEPAGRDSAAAMAAAACEADGDDAILAFISADHHVPDEAAFRDAIVAAARAAADGLIVTLGVKPTHASVAYGYIQPAEDGPVVGPVARFVEKPLAPAARDFVAAGYLWNSGNFVVSKGALLAELQAFAPATLAAVRQAVDEGRREADALWLGEAFAGAPRISIDYAVMEKTRIAAVLPVDFVWSDLGAWDAIWAASAKDPDGNAISPGVVLQGVTNSLVRTDPSRRVTLVGVRDVAVITEGDDLLICDMAHSQALKPAVERLLAQPRAAFADLDAAGDWLDRWLFTAALPLWWTLGADHLHGGFHETLSLSGAPCASDRRVRVQARQAVVYANAGGLGWTGPWRQAAWHGLDYLTNHYRRPDGLYRSKVAQAGDPVDDRAYLYDQTFVLLALASLFEAEPHRADLAVAAGDLRARLEGFKAPAGGYRETDSPHLLSNPHMHLLECALAWARLDPARWTPLADEVARLALDRMFDPEAGVIREFYDEDWRPVAGPEGRIVWSGHQFEWAWLLERWGRWRRDPKARVVAARLFDSGSRTVDRARNVAVGASLDDFSILDPVARLWPQTERLKASLWFGDLDQALAAANSLKPYLTAPVAGVWRERRLADGAFQVEAAPASSFYHVAGALGDLRLWRAGRIEVAGEAGLSQEHAACKSDEGKS